MNPPPDPGEEPEALQRLIARGGRVRPLDDRERAVLLARFRRRGDEVDAPPRRVGAALGLALGAIGALGGVAALRLQDDSEHVPPPARSASAATQTGRASTHAHAYADAGVATTAQNVRTARRFSLGGRGEIALTGDVVARVPPALEAGGQGSIEVALERGTLTASVGPRRQQEPLSIVTPHVAVVVIGTRFSVVVEGDQTKVAVEHGRVRVDRGARSVFVDAGDALKSDDPRLAPPPDSPFPASSAPCADAPQRRRCLREAARGRGLAAENALFALALHERDERRDPDAALSLLRTYVRRFPRGVLVPDAVLTAARLLRETGREQEACALVARHAAQLASPPPTWLTADCVAPEARQPGRDAR
ncbi:MAG: FecR family protein [Polyangiales bacterium]